MPFGPALNILSFRIVADKHIRLTFNGVRNDKLLLSGVCQVFYQETLDGSTDDVGAANRKFFPLSWPRRMC